SIPDPRPGQPQTNKRKCGSQPADQSLFTDVFRSRPLLCTIHCVTQLHASTWEEVLSRTLGLTWDIRDFRPTLLHQRDRQRRATNRLRGCKQGKGVPSAKPSRQSLPI